MASQNIIVRAVYKLSLTVRPCWVIGDVGGQKEKKKQVFHYTRWHVCVRQLAVRGLVRFFFLLPRETFMRPALACRPAYIVFVAGWCVPAVRIL